MALRDLLVHIDDTEAGRRRAATAIALAKQHGAHLTGLYLLVEGYVPSFVQAQLPPEFVKERRAELQAQAERVARAFSKSTEGEVEAEARIERCAWANAPGALAQHARHADLAILGQPDPEEDEVLGEALAESVFLSSGRPAIIVPYIGARRTPGGNVLVAWNGGREAARAVGDAMPILERAKTVTVLAINPEPGPESTGPEPGADIALHLARHKIVVDVRTTRSDEMEAGDALLSEISDLGADLVVMGGYGHSRVRELVLGGVTRHMLQHMTVPIFVSH